MYNISSDGDATDFGDVSEGRYSATGCADKLKAFHIGGQTASSQAVTQIDVWVQESAGNSTDFGDLTSRSRTQSMSSACAAHGGI